MARLKICGLKRAEDIEYVNQLKPDYIGFIISAGYKRSIDYATAKQLKARLNKNIKAVGVFVNDNIDTINKYLSDGIIDIVQLHGNEAPEYCNKINAPLIKYFNPDNFDKIDNYNVDYYLFDSGAGTGNTFDWSKIPKTTKPFFLAGGINSDNINDAIAKINPFAIDLSSAVEVNGVKDYNKIKEIMEKIK